MIRLEVISLFIRQVGFMTKDTMEQVFSTTAFMTLDSRHDGKLRAVTLWLSIRGITPVADKTCGITVILE
jgi:hypothetical protein